jgi:hypothetical protein
MGADQRPLIADRWLLIGPVKGQYGRVIAYFLAPTRPYCFFSLVNEDALAHSRVAKPVTCREPVPSKHPSWPS